MKKIALTYVLIVNSICLIICLVNQFLNGPKFSDISLTLISLLSLICYFCIQSNRIVKTSYFVLCVIYFLQSFSILIGNLIWKLIIGTDLSFYLIRQGDLTTKLDFKVFNIFAFVNTTSNGENWGIGLNFIHILVFCSLCKCFGSLMKK
ncbi:hypothetical protein C8C84_2628 [Flavobacterium sp. 102]|nr:hypothetical protein C8C84_2628 [Flavobacterium sp. 102]